MLKAKLWMAAKNDFFKFINNSVFAETIESIRNHKNMKLVTSLEKYDKYVMKPNFKDEHMGKTKIKTNTPIYLGQAILDLNRMLMYGFHNDYIQPYYEGRVKICYMDTGSFLS